MLQQEIRKAIRFLDGRITCPAAFVEGWLEAAGVSTSYTEIEYMLGIMTGNGLPDHNDIPLDDMADWFAGTATGIQMF